MDIRNHTNTWGIAYNSYNPNYTHPDSACVFRFSFCHFRLLVVTTRVVCWDYSTPCRRVSLQRERCKVRLDGVVGPDNLCNASYDTTRLILDTTALDWLDCFCAAWFFHVSQVLSGAQQAS